MLSKALCGGRAYEDCAARTQAREAALQATILSKLYVFSPQRSKRYYRVCLTANKETGHAHQLMRPARDIVAASCTAFQLGMHNRGPRTLLELAILYLGKTTTSSTSARS